MPSFKVVWVDDRGNQAIGRGTTLKVALKNVERSWKDAYGEGSPFSKVRAYVSYVRDDGSSVPHKGE